MFRNDFYTIKQNAAVVSGFVATIAFNQHHFIYQAHFPQNPITPGVMLLEIAKELIAEHYQQFLTMTVARNVKFLHVVNPIQHPEVDFKIATSIESDGMIKATINIEKADIVFAKISSIYKKVE